MTQICIDLPYPPSTNHLWRRVGGQTILSKEARLYRKAVHARVVAERCVGGSLQWVSSLLPLAGRLSLFLILVSPTQAACDLDNKIKAVQDALTYAGVWRDDQQVDDLRIVRGPIDRQRAAIHATITVISL